MFIVYKFPSLHGTPRHFERKWAAILYAFWVEWFRGYVAEIYGPDYYCGGWRQYFQDRVSARGATIMTTEATEGRK